MSRNTMQVLLQMCNIKMDIKRNRAGHKPHLTGSEQWWSSVAIVMNSIKAGNFIIT